MDVRVAIDLRRGCLENFCSQTLGKSQHVDGAMDAGLRRLYWIVLVVNGRSRAGEVVDLIDLNIERKSHVVPNKLEPMMVEHMINVALRASEEIVDAYDVPTISEQPLTEIRAEKAGSPGNQYACFKMHTPEFPLDYATTIGLGVPSPLYVPYWKAISYLENQDAIKKAC
jgi:hypothetical protein